MPACIREAKAQEAVQFATAGRLKHKAPQTADSLPLVIVATQPTRFTAENESKLCKYRSCTFFRPQIFFCSDRVTGKPRTGKIIQPLTSTCLTLH